MVELLGSTPGSCVLPVFLVSPSLLCVCLNLGVAFVYEWKMTKKNLCFVLLSPCYSRPLTDAKVCLPEKTAEDNELLCLCVIFNFRPDAAHSTGINRLSARPCWGIIFCQDWVFILFSYGQLVLC